MKTRIMAALASLILLATFSAELFGQKAKKFKFKEKRFEEVVKGRLSDYEGVYAGIEPSYVIEVRAGADGGLIVSSLEDNQKVRLENVMLEGARLSATKIYPDGRTEKFEGTFSNRILNGERAFGILVDGLHLNLNGLSLDRVFYRRVAP